MTAHTHTVLTPGCYRCDLNADEMRGHLDEAKAEIRSLDYAIRVLTDQQRELREQVVGLDKALAKSNKETQR